MTKMQATGGSGVHSFRANALRGRVNRWGLGWVGFVFILAIFAIKRLLLGILELSAHGVWVEVYRITELGSRWAMCCLTKPSRETDTTPESLSVEISIDQMSTPSEYALDIGFMIYLMSCC